LRRGKATRWEPSKNLWRGGCGGRGRGVKKRQGHYIINNNFSGGEEHGGFRPNGRLVYHDAGKERKARRQTKGKVVQNERRVYEKDEGNDSSTIGAKGESPRKREIYQQRPRVMGDNHTKQSASKGGWSCAILLRDFTGVFQTSTTDSSTLERSWGKRLFWSNTVTRGQMPEDDLTEKD